MGEARRRLRAALEGPDMPVAPFVYDALGAKLVEAAGFPAAYMSGFGTAAARGLPDLGLLGLREMAENAASLARAVSIPVVCDADTGYGNETNVAHTVRSYEDAGAAALHIEDQVWPKRCGFFAGKEVIPLDAMRAKVEAAVAARRDPELVVIARTDALQPEGWDGAERRARAYREAGADLVFVDGVAGLEDLDAYAERLADLPRVYNGQLPPDEVRARGFRLMLHIGTLPVAFRALADALAELRATGAVAATRDGEAFRSLAELLGAGAAVLKGPSGSTRR